MEEIFYPSREILESWVDIVRHANPIIELALPVINENWYLRVLGTIDRVNNDYTQGISCKAAHIFYYIIKDHNFIDGNKRSGIAVTYLFFFVNGYEVRSAERIRQLAKNLARSHGARNKDDWIRKIEKEFSYVCRPVKNN